MNYFVALIVSIGVLHGLSILLDNALAKYLPVYYYVEYTNLETMADEYAPGTKSITMLTTSKWKKSNVPVVYYTELHCICDNIGGEFNNGDKWIKRGYQKWEAVRNKKDNTKIPSMWKFKTQLPLNDSTCIVRNTIEIDKGFGYKESIKIDSNIFTVRNDTE